MERTLWRAAWIKPVALVVTAVVVTAFPVAAYDAVEVTGGGSVTGTVTFAGTPPAPRKILVDKDVEVCGMHEKLTEELLVSGQNKAIRNVVVSLAGVKSGKALVIPETNFSLDQRGCQFTPHIQLIPVGATLDILNEDGIMHNIHTLSLENPSFNRAQPKFKKKIQTSFDFPETIRIKCDAHNWMGGWLIVVDHPYYALTDDSGSFEITDIPPGDYTLEYWHESLGRRSEEITVAAGAETVADISWKPKEKTTTGK